MPGCAIFTDSEQRAFEQLVEDLRIRAFRIYEAVREAQRDRDAGARERLRSLSLAGSLAADLAEQVMLLNYGKVALAGEVEIAAVSA